MLNRAEDKDWAGPEESNGMEGPAGAVVVRRRFAFLLSSSSGCSFFLLFLSLSCLSSTLNAELSNTVAVCALRHLWTHCRRRRLCARTRTTRHVALGVVSVMDASLLSNIAHICFSSSLRNSSCR